MFHADKVDGVLENAKNIRIVAVELTTRRQPTVFHSGVNLLGNVPVDKDIAWFGRCNNAFGHSRVCTTYPERLTRSSDQDRQARRRLTCGYWPLADSAKKVGSLLLTALAHWALEARRASISDMVVTVVPRDGGSLVFKFSADRFHDRQFRNPTIKAS